jgi:uncharacterized protein with LGFP repeats
MSAVPPPGAFNHFVSPSGNAQSSIYYSAATGAKWIRGDIRTRWANYGWEESRLGFPKNEEFVVRVDNYENSYTVRQDFQCGYILWYSPTRETRITVTSSTCQPDA